MLAALGVATAITLAGTPALADEAAHPDQEYQCSPGILGTGVLCNAAPAPGPAPEDDIFQGGPLGADSPLVTVLGGLLG